ncbi:MAG: D-alanine--D-alanine ligase [Nevskiaceae bacterium]|nr:MAG: D-alanine--D-alanine ligase [Nevskiaceae bacterium]TBR73387.1 MAG: D-alanine--D-alanine ligase [Nevskiaceae bacterium]
MRKQIVDPAEFGRVAVLMGGWSAEREVSLWSGKNVTEALQAKGVDAVAVDCDRRRVLHLADEGFVRAFNVLHGTGGEDGTVQAVLELQGIAYPGCGVLASALTMDKVQTKRLWQAAGLPTPGWRGVASVADAHAAAAAFGYPFILKPTAEGSSVGVSKVHGAAEVEAAFHAAWGDGVTSGRRPAGHAVIAESFVTGGEYTASIIDGAALPLIQIEPDGEFYDYHAKYLSDRTRYHCPVDLDPAHEVELRQVCLQAWEAVGGSGWGRVDFILDATGKPALIEINTVPGMTSHSLVPMAARANGMDFPTLCWTILETSLSPAEGAA